MFAGHLGAALAFKCAERHINLGLFLFAALLLDVILWTAGHHRNRRRDQCMSGSGRRSQGRNLICYQITLAETLNFRTVSGLSSTPSPGS